MRGLGGLLNEVPLDMLCFNLSFLLLFVVVVVLISGVVVVKVVDFVVGVVLSLVFIVAFGIKVTDFCSFFVFFKDFVGVVASVCAVVAKRFVAVVAKRFVAVGKSFSLSSSFSSFSSSSFFFIFFRTSFTFSPRLFFSSCQLNGQLN